MRFRDLGHTVLRSMIWMTLCILAFLLVSRPRALGGLPYNLFLPYRASESEVLVRMLAFGLGPLFGPLLGVILQMRRGGRGLLGGLLAGIILYGVYSLFINYFFPQPDPFKLGVLGNLLVFSLIGAVNGLAVGVAAWSLFGISGWMLSEHRTH